MPTFALGFPWFEVFTEYVLDHTCEEGTMLRARRAARGHLRYVLPFATVAFFLSPPLPSAAQIVCAGDCNNDGTVTVNEIITLVNITLGTADASACPHGIQSGGSVDIALIIQAVNNALNGCPMANPTPTATPGEVAPTPTPVPTPTPGGGGACLRVSGGNSTVKVMNSSPSWIDVYLGSSVGFGGDQAPGECFLYGIQLDDGEALDTQVQISQCTPAGDGSCGDPPNDFGPTEYVPIDLQSGQTVTITVGSNFFD